MQKSLALLQMHEGEEVGSLAALSEVQAKLRLGCSRRLGFALEYPLWILHSGGRSSMKMTEFNAQRARAIDSEIGEGSSNNTDSRAA